MGLRNEQFLKKIFDDKAAGSKFKNGLKRFSFALKITNHSNYASISISSEKSKKKIKNNSP